MTTSPLEHKHLLYQTTMAICLKAREMLPLLRLPTSPTTAPLSLRTPKYRHKHNPKHSKTNVAFPSLPQQ
jgi:hypothetical protein